MGCYESFMILWLAGLMLLLLSERIGMGAERKGRPGRVESSAHWQEEQCAPWQQ